MMLALLMWAAMAAAQSAGKRVALLVGNGSYNVRPLSYPAADVQEVSGVLKSLGFQVTIVRDVDQKALQRAIRDFGAAASGADIAWFYYSGHGLQSGGDNYLLPLAAQIDKESDIAIEAVSVQGLMRQIDEARPKVAVVVLDACRDNPLAARAKSTAKGL
jgi:uncharacterized caspase-like protein